MRLNGFIPSISGFSLLLGACAGDPDLTISQIEHLGGFSCATDTIGAPVRVVVENIGDKAAGVFKISTQYTGAPVDPTREFSVAFSVAGTPDPVWYPFTEEPLGAGASKEFTGEVHFLNSKLGATVSLNALADSCSGDEFMPSYCRVNESNEDNNRSANITISLPATCP